LKDLRASLASHIVAHGGEPLMSDTATFGVTPGMHSHDACLEQVDLADYLILIIGGRRGGSYVGSEESITNEEYKRALARKIPVMTFLRVDVWKAMPLYQKNPKGNFIDVVDDVRIFDFVRRVQAQSEDNWIKTFETAEDIKNAITAQLAYVCLLYSKQLVESRSPKKTSPQRARLAPFPSSFPKLNSSSELERTEVIKGLNGLYQRVKAIQQSEMSGKEEKLKVLWVLGRHGDLSGPSNQLVMPEPQFKGLAWGVTKGRNVFTQLRLFGIGGDYEPNFDNQLEVQLSFENDDDGAISVALYQYVHDLLDHTTGDANAALELFKRADMSLYS
jgi:hypothetical protein